MEHIKEIDMAIGAHGMWKSRLKKAIDTGTLDSPVATIRANNQCAFGKWLHGATITPQDKTTEVYKTVVELHTQFHKAAAQIAQLAASGKGNEAETLLASHGEFAKLSSQLTAAMLGWKKNLTATPVR